MRPWFAMLLLFAVPARAGSVEVLDGRRLTGEVDIRGESIVVQQAGRVDTLSLTDVFRVQFADDPPRRPVLGLGARTADVAISTEHAVPLNQSAMDSLNGRVGILRQGEKRERKPRPGLTDARSASQPSDDNGWFSGDVTWDLGMSIPAPMRQLDSISVWITASDAARCDYAGAWAVSSDGEHYTEIPGTRKAITFGRGARDGTFNHVVYTFEPGRVSGFRFLRLIADKPAGGDETRYVEVDAFVSRADSEQARQPSIVTRHGTVLVGPITRADGASVVVHWHKEVAVPRPEVAGIRFYRMVEEELLRLAEGRKGALLDSRDFLEGELKGIEGGAVRLDSVLFGRRRLDAGREVLAVCLSEIRPQGRWRVGLTDGSTLLVRSLRCDAEQVVLDDPCLGTLEVPRGQVARISPGPDRMHLLSQPAIASTTRPAATPHLADYAGDRVIAIPSGQECSFDVDPGALAFSARAGASPSAEVQGSVCLVVLVDGQVRYNSGPRTRRDASEPVLLPLKNARRIALRVEAAGAAKNGPEGLFVDSVLVR